MSDKRLSQYLKSRVFELAETAATAVDPNLKYEASNRMAELERLIDFLAVDGTSDEDRTGVEL